MKKVSLIALLVLFVMGVQAQEETASFYVKQGSEAYKAKDYMGAYSAYKKAMKLNEEANTQDTALFFNAGVAAYKAGKYANAGGYFGKAAELGYKEKSAYKFQAYAYKKADDPESMEAGLKKAVEKYPNNETFTEMLASAYLKKGLAPYEAGAKIIKDAAPLREADVEQYNAEVDKAAEKFQEALPFMEKAHELDPDKKGAINALITIYSTMELPEKADEMKAKLP